MLSTISWCPRFLWLCLCQFWIGQYPWIKWSIFSTLFSIIEKYCIFLAEGLVTVLFYPWNQEWMLLKATLNHVKLSGHNPRALYLFSQLSTNSSLCFQEFLVGNIFFNGKKPNYFTLLYRACPEYLPNIPAHFWSNL
jgi:hypothetical protein